MTLKYKQEVSFHITSRSSKSYIGTYSKYFLTHSSKSKYKRNNVFSSTSRRSKPLSLYALKPFSHYLAYARYITKLYTSRNSKQYNCMHYQPFTFSCFTTINIKARSITSPSTSRSLATIYTQAVLCFRHKTCAHKLYCLSVGIERGWF